MFACYKDDENCWLVRTVWLWSTTVSKHQTSCDCKSSSREISLIVPTCPGHCLLLMLLLGVIRPLIGWVPTPYSNYDWKDGRQVHKWILAHSFQYPGPRRADVDACIYVSIHTWLHVSIWLTCGAAYLYGLVGVTQIEWGWIGPPIK